MDRLRLFRFNCIAVSSNCIALSDNAALLGCADLMASESCRTLEKSVNVPFLNRNAVLRQGRHVPVLVVQALEDQLTNAMQMKSGVAGLSTRINHLDREVL